MDFIFCPICHKQISITAHSCPHCGHPIDEKDKTELKQTAKNVEKIVKRKESMFKFGCFMVILTIVLVGGAFATGNLREVNFIAVAVIFFIGLSLMGAN
ncbi:MAG: zinc-ribbon domain-containing protein [Candidatus Brocadiae bacterium]|nr:zinc-ribbon domain-containing protein [Candidatus Brocadiia bacterium]